VAAITGQSGPKLGIDAVGGPATGRLAQALGPAATLVVYGAMSGQAMQADAGQFVFKDLRLRGFWLTKFLAEAQRQNVVSLYDRLSGLALNGAFKPEISGRFHVSQIQAALAHAEETMGRGKTLVTFD
jgi:NADPH:quinone reductase-like Zn-dependent oxidoreductase